MHNMIKSEKNNKKKKKQEMTMQMKAKNKNSNHASIVYVAFLESMVLYIFGAWVLANH